jgi:hypothetical protein
LAAALLTCASTSRVVPVIRNLARSAWELRRAEEAGPDELLIAAYHRKSNGKRRALPFGMRLRFESDSAGTVADADLEETPDSSPARA